MNRRNLFRLFAAAPAALVPLPAEPEPQKVVKLYSEGLTIHLPADAPIGTSVTIVHLGADKIAVLK